MKNFNNKNKAFTLAELMVCLAIISVIATLLMPAINKLRPNKNKVMFKKAYYLSERIISELVNDEEAYPFVEDRVGFDNTDAIELNGTTYGGGGSGTGDRSAKLCNLFALKMNTLSETPNCTAAATYDNPSFTTTDGVKWVMPYTTFNDQDAYYVIALDVNGDSEPNCLETAEGCIQPDRFEIQVRADGKMRIADTHPITRDYIGTTNMVENQR